MDHDSDVTSRAQLPLRRGRTRYTRRIFAVVKDGRVFSRSDLDALLSQVRAAVRR